MGQINDRKVERYTKRQKQQTLSINFDATSGVSLKRKETLKSVTYLNKILIIII